MSEHAPLAPGGNVSSFVDNGVADVCFGHPKSNSLPASVLRALANEITRLGARDDVRVVLLRSYGTSAFCAGASFDELVAIQDPAAGKEFFMGFARVILAMTRCPKPIIARAHGKVVGGGVGIVAAADYAMGTENASLRLSELAVGIGPFVVGPVIEHRIGVGAFAPMAIDADWRDAAWGERHSLYARVFPTVDALDQACNAFAASTAAANPEAVARIKQITWQGTDHWPALLEERAAVSGTLVLSDFTRKALAKFATGRALAAMSVSLTQLALVVRDYDEAIAYFVGVLGFELLEDTPLSPEKRWVRVAPAGQGGAGLLLARAATPDQESRIGDQTGGRVFLFLRTDDFERDYNAFLSRGVAFTETPRREAYGRVVVFRDLYGNKWDLVEQIAHAT